MSATWAIIVGVLLIFMAVTSSMLQRLPLNSSMIYLAVGFGIGPAGLNLLRPNLEDNATLLEHIAEIGLLISLFSAGLKLRLPLKDIRWRLAFRLALWGLLVSIALTIPLMMWLDFPFAIALLLAAAIAPTDPVLAADVQVDDEIDRDRLRFSLTGESSLNDGIAFPLVIIALALIAAPDSSSISNLSLLLNWLVIDCMWGFLGGIAIGAICGHAISRLVLYLRTQQKEALGLDEFLVLGLIALAYGSAILLHVSPFLAVLFAGLSMGRTADEKSSAIPSYPIEKLDELAISPKHAAPLMMRALRGFNEQLERIAEVAIVLLVGALLTSINISMAAVAICLFTFCVARPVSVYISLLGTNVTATQQRLMAWFGIRGIGSIYYAFFALNHGIPDDWRELFLSTILLVCATSIIAHGISVTPLMNYYRRNSSRK